MKGCIPLNGRDNVGVRECTCIVALEYLTCRCLSFMIIDMSFVTIRHNSGLNLTHSNGFGSGHVNALLAVEIWRKLSFAFLA